MQFRQELRGEDQNQSWGAGMEEKETGAPEPNEVAP